MWGGNRGQTKSKIKFVDLFAGIGGASTGAALAGYDVVLAVDNDAYALAVHEMNHPECVHLLSTLPPEMPLPLPRGQDRWHLHGSPPCTKVSKAQQCREEEDREVAVAMVEWFVEFAMSSSAESWSMEQVATPVVLECLQKYAKDGTMKRRFDYEVVRMSKHGIPQNRKRVIAGSPDVVSRARRLSHWRRSVSSVIETPRGTHLRAWVVTGGKMKDPTGEQEFVTRKYTQDEGCTPITKVGPCVIAGYPLRCLLYTSPSPRDS